MAKVVLNGLPHFTKLTAEFLTSHTTDRFVPVEYLPFGRRKTARYLAEIATARAVVSFWGAVTVGDQWGRAMELASRMRKRCVFMWMGTDVMWAQERPVIDAFRSSEHYCESSWTRDELTAIGFDARLLPRSPFTHIPRDDQITTPSSFVVLAYLGIDREDFFNYPILARLAREHPDVPFRVVGSSGVDDAPKNIEFLGWVDSERLHDLYREAAVYVRLPKHDGCSYSVREALSWGRPVIASYPYPYSLHASSPEAASEHLRLLRESFDDGRFQPNLDGREYVRTEYAPDRVARVLHSALARR